jgi:hypothetical protein
MYEPARLLAGGVLLAATVFTSASAQVNIQPTPQPIVTAENEPWYRSGEPIMFAGNLYYPAGAAIHFLANEMVRSALYQGVPLYSRTTIEPYSVVFVPIAGGMMQPYERRRTGELAGTSGSSVSALPLDIPSPAARSAAPILQAAAPPIVGSPPADEFPAPTPQTAVNRPPSTENDSRVAPPAVGTSGRVASSQRSVSARTRRGAANGIFIEFDNSRWFSSGPPVSPDSRLLTKIGEFHGFPVYAARNAPSTIYIPVAQGVDALVPYSRRN